MSYYQKYRPKTIDELDLKSVRETLQSFLKSGNLNHAYLFIGPRGAGKTSTARILAQVATCEENLGKKELNEPCGKCNACLSIQGGAAVDVIEMDAASHRSIEDIRDLREKIRLTPVALSKKIYIIDEVHMLTTEAFNALLKTLEEPPAHAMFFLCTTEAHKVPETIMSRCTVVKFAKAKTDEIVRSLNKAVAGEELKVEDGVLEMISEATDGSFREGHKLLEQLSSKGTKITKDEARDFLGLAKGRAVGKLVEFSIAGEPKKVVELIDELEQGGVKAQVLVGSLLREVKVKMEETMDRGGFATFARLADKLITAAEKVKQSPLPMLPVELALLSVAVDEERSRDRKVEENEHRGEKSADPVIKRSLPRVEVVAESALDSVAQNYEGPLASIDRVKSEWGNFLTDLAPRNQSIAGLLRSATPLAVQGRDLTLEVFYPFHKDQLEQDSKRKVVEEAVARTWGRMNVRCVLGKKGEQMREEIEASSGGEKGEDKVAQAVSGSVEEIFGV
ncbi:MAG: hypothetical protein UX12_C0007G0008 [Candidatus Collierbacteria bacterium GW2011_GWC1_45_47]|uniref:DNA polymerase III subunit gamma/tau n=1 Tax=Candidatus Collierbacteria bacterium GW2011_GWB1_44_35 TaxID=1618383 RepID=A0A0G1J8N8_9BACT|nr:MAG: polymerase III, subunit gamma and tau protein [Candidatus Collierbacteria bacterium GW2011_GWB1_44_35]KKU09603.1 MAG: hypothetical protein UX12_C0007G0008 [Candidatus Collierbacteria bacterium GW2011_GWC1_45_47]